jgi:hypothetical protein
VSVAENARRIREARARDPENECVKKSSAWLGAAEINNRCSASERLSLLDHVNIAVAVTGGQNNRSVNKGSLLTLVPLLTGARNFAWNSSSLGKGQDEARRRKMKVQERRRLARFSRARPRFLQQGVQWLDLRWLTSRYPQYITGRAYNNYKRRLSAHLAYHRPLVKLAARHAFDPRCNNYCASLSIRLASLLQPRQFNVRESPRPAVPDTLLYKGNKELRRYCPGGRGAR